MGNGASYIPRYAKLGFLLRPAAFCRLPALLTASPLRLIIR
ncbi:hypothetical protein [Neisseria lactamica]|nr:hypothetical protein [Neisseria lactamica]